MRQTFLRALSALMALTLLLLVFPALAGHTASAATAIGKVTISGVTAPKVGSAPSYTAYVYATGCSRETGDGIWYHNGIAWKDVTTGQMMTSTDKYVSGHTYQVTVSMIANSGYTFCDGSKNVVATGTINGYAAGTVRWSDSNVGFTYEFPPEGVVPNVFITDIDAPQIGKTPDYTCNYGPTDKVTYDTISSGNWRNGVQWFDVTAGGASIAPTDKFIEGHIYKVRFSVYSKTGYSFCDSNRNVATKGTINGNAASAVRYSNTNVAFEYTFPALSRTVKTVEVSGIDAPKAGSKPDYTATVYATGAKLEGYTLGAWKNGIQWVNVTDNKDMNPTDSFEAGKVYKVVASLVPETGYVFVDGSGSVVTKGTLNGQAAQIVKYTVSNIGVSYQFAVLDTIVSAVTATDVDAPVAGKTPDYAVTLSGAGYALEAFDAPAWVHGVYWYDMTANLAMKPADTFQAGHEYRITLSLKPDAGYTFKDGSGNIVTPGTINGNAVTETYDYNDGTIAYSYIFPKLAEPVRDVAIAGIDAPAAGQRPDYTASGSGAGYRVETEFNADPMWRNGVVWYDVTTSDALNAATDTFVDGHQYKVVVSVVTNSGYYFDTASAATINGEAASVYTIWNAGNAGFQYTFPALPKAVTLIGGVAVTDIDAPVAGQTPDYDVTVSATGCHKEDINDGEWKNGVCWRDLTTDEGVKTTDTFIAGHEYMVIISMTSDSGYTFLNEDGDIATAGTVNGSAAQASRNTAENIGFKYTFPKVEGVEIPAVLIESVDIIGLTAPAVGETPDYDVTAAGPGYGVEDSSFMTLRNGVLWHDETTADDLSSDDTFMEGHAYTVTVSIVPLAGYTFWNDSGEVVATGAIDGVPVTRVEDCCDGSVGFSLTFPALHTEPKLIPSVNVIATAPAQDEKVNYEVILDGEGVSLKDENWLEAGGQCVHGVIWSNLSLPDTAMNVNSTFSKGSQYKITVKLTPDAGYTFLSGGDTVGTVVTFNGQPATSANPDGTFSFVFPELGSAHLFPVDFTGFAPYEGGLFYVSGGDVVTSVNGLKLDPNDPATWYFCANGQVQTQYSGLAEYGGEWFYLENGKLNTTRTGIVEYNGGRFMIAAGRILREVNGLIQDPNTGLWYYVSAGQVADYTGLVMYDGAWFYVINGELALSYTGPVEYDGATFNVVGGQVVA